MPSRIPLNEGWPTWRVRPGRLLSVLIAASALSGLVLGLSGGQVFFVVILSLDRGRRSRR